MTEVKEETQAKKAPKGKKEAKKVKPPKTKEFTSSYGNKFTFQRVLPSEYIKLSKKLREDESLLFQLMLDNVVAVPSGLDVDDFELSDEYYGFDELKEVATAAANFQSGKLQ